MKSITLIAPGIERLKQMYDKLLSRFALNFNLRRYAAASIAASNYARVAASLPDPGKAVQVDPRLITG
jgi:hypothetical protein